MIRNRRLVAIVIAVFIIVVSIAAYFIFNQPGSGSQPEKSFVKQGDTVMPQESTVPKPGSSPTPSSAAYTPASAEQISQTINKGAPYLVNQNGQSKYGIVKTVQPLPGWYVVTIRLNGVASEPGKVILQQTDNPNNPLTIVAGPGTSFPPEYISLPSAVRKALK